MLKFLEAILPKEIIIEIAIFDGRILRAYLRDYVSQLYARTYKEYFGYRYTLRVITGGHAIGHDTMGGLPFYAAWSTLMRQGHPERVKVRKPRIHMRPYVGIIPPHRLVKERLLIEAKLAHFFNPKTGGARYRALMRL